MQKMKMSMRYRRPARGFLVILAVLCAQSAAWSLNSMVCLIPASSVPDAGVGTITGVKEVEGGALFYGDGLYWYADGKVSDVLVDDDGDDISVSSIEAVPGGMLINTFANGLYLFAGGHAERIAGVVGEHAWGMVVTRNGVLIGVGDGVVRYAGGTLHRVEGVDVGKVTSYAQTGDAILLGGSGGSNPGHGLHVLRNDRISSVPGGDVGPIFDFHEMPGGVLLRASGALYLYSAGQLNLVEGGTGQSVTVVSTQEDTLVAQQAKSRWDLFRLVGHSLRRIADVDVYVQGGSALLPVNGGVLVGSRQGLYVYSAGRLTLVPGPNVGPVNALFPLGSGVLVGGEAGTYLFAQGHLTPLAGPKHSQLVSAAAMPDGNGGIAGDAQRLYWLGNGGLWPIAGGAVGGYDNDMPASEAYADEYYLARTSSGFVIGAHAGIFSAIDVPLGSPGVLNLTNKDELQDTRVYAPGITFKWTLHHPCASAVRDLGIHIVPNDPSHNVGKPIAAVVVENHDLDANIQATVPISSPGEWSFGATAKIYGVDVRVGPASDQVRFFGGSADWAAYWLGRAGPFVALAVFVANVCLFIMARYSRRAWLLVTDPDWMKAPIRLPMLFLRHWRYAQLWILDLYVREQTVEAHKRRSHFAPLPLTDRNGETLDGEAVLNRLREYGHVWIQGRPGMGKTALFRRLTELAYCEEGASAFSVFKRHGYVLVAVEARRFAGDTGDRATADWLVRCIQRVLGQHDFPIDDLDLLKTFLRTGILGVAVDGLNEVDREGTIRAFAADFPRTVLFATSQEIGQSPFKTWRLPRTIGEHVKELLEAYLGHAVGAALYERVCATGLVHFLKSGYDVRLVVALASRDPNGLLLPTDLIGLYRAVIKEAWPDGDARSSLLGAAAWKVMAERGPNDDKRRLRPDTDLPEDLLKSLAGVEADNDRAIRLVRPVPPNYEFIHDQMNAFLAAQWLAALATAAAVCEQIASAKIWLETSETQRALWGFLASLIDDPLAIEVVWRFAQQDDRRSVLGRALAERAGKLGLTLTLEASQIGTTYIGKIPQGDD